MNSSDLIGATYARISTAKQKDGISLSDQDSRMSLYAVHNAIAVPEAFRFSEQESGFKEDRDVYDKIRQLVRERRINVLIIYGSDRHTREPIHGEIFRAELRRNNVSLHIITEGGEVDIITPTGQFFRRQMDNFNWYWGKMIQQTTQEKKRAYTEQGIPYQQGTVRYGYRRVGRQGNAHLEINESLREVVENIYRWYDRNERPVDMVAKLSGIPTPGDLRHCVKQRAYGEWAESMIYGILRDEIYTGVYYASRFKNIEDEQGRRKRVPRPREEWIAISVPAIIDRALWERVQKRLEQGQTRSPRLHGKYEYLIARLCTCRMLVNGQDCGYSVRGLTSINRPGRTSYYICQSCMADRIRPKCDLPYFHVAKVDAAVWDFTKQLLEDPTAMLITLRAAQEELMREQELLIQRIAEIDELTSQHMGELDLLVREFRKAQGTILFEVIKRQANELQETIEGLKGQRAKLEAQLGQQTISDEDIQALEGFAREVKNRLPHATFQDKRAIIEALRFTFELAFEEGERIVYVVWHMYEFRLPVGENSESCRSTAPRACPPHPRRTTRAANR